jgi:GNAT superfamily N-acetyltransferase
MQEVTRLLHRAYARLGAMGLNYTAVDQTTDVTAERIDGGQCFMAEADGLLVGTVVVKPTYSECECAHYTKSGVAIVQQFAVDPSLQGKGIGRRLLDACETWATARGFRHLALDTSEQAVHLTNLYARLGYSHVDVVQWPGKVYRSAVLSKAIGSS